MAVVGYGFFARIYVVTEISYQKFIILRSIIPSFNVLSHYSINLVAVPNVFVTQLVQVHF